MKKIRGALLLLFVPLMAALPAFHGPTVLKLTNDHISLQWQKTTKGWELGKVNVYNGRQWIPVGIPSGEYTLLYAAQKPDSVANETFNTSTHSNFIEPAYQYQAQIWQQSIAPVALNTSGQASYFFPETGFATGNVHLTFKQETLLASIATEWTIDPDNPTDILVEQVLIAKRAGYFSLSTPSLTSIGEKELAWATVPGYFQGNTIQKDFVLAYAYGQGIPEKPVIYRERAASTPSAIISTKDNISFSVVPEPEEIRDPWAVDKSTHQRWQTGISHRNRKSLLSPTLYFPVLGEPGSRLNVKDTVSFRFRYSLQTGDWYKMYKHIANNIFHFKQSLSERRNKQSLTNRIEKIADYLSDSKTSLWNIENFNGSKIGGQSYLGGVVGAKNDAIKNADYGAMWMLAGLSSNERIKDSVLPFALNFKLAQQQTDTGFFNGAAIGQYYLTKSKKFVEEWGSFVEPVGLTYYVMLDIGNVLLFDPANVLLRERLRQGADLLLKWQKGDGSWEVAYDRYSHQPCFKDLRDLRATFYGLLVAYRMLKDDKYLRAAMKGADWYIKNAVEKGHFIGVCGDARYVPDFATGQSAQALLDLYDLTGIKRYRDAAVSVAKIYTTSVYTVPAPLSGTKMVNNVARQSWEIAQTGLSFEHGGILGSANTKGPILLCSHAGMFVRFFELTHDSLFIDMARCAAIGRDAFVDPKTNVASYYWDNMDKGPGLFPHHAWWQIGWITDYLMAEAALRSGNRITFSRGFITPKVGPHQPYGFASGTIYNNPADLIIREGLVKCKNPDIECITATGKKDGRFYIILMNDIGLPVSSKIQIDPDKLKNGERYTIEKITALDGNNNKDLLSGSVVLPTYGIAVFAVDCKKKAVNSL